MHAVTYVPSENAYTDGTADSSSSYRLTLSAMPTVPAGGVVLLAAHCVGTRCGHPYAALRGHACWRDHLRAAALRPVPAP